MCQAYGAKYVECFPSPYTAAEAAGQCQLYVNHTAHLYGQVDATKLEDHFACLSGLSCEQLWSDQQLCPL